MFYFYIYIYILTYETTQSFDINQSKNSYKHSEQIHQKIHNVQNTRKQINLTDKSNRNSHLHDINVGFSNQIPIHSQFWSLCASTFDPAVMTRYFGGYSLTEETNWPLTCTIINTLKFDYERDPILWIPGWNFSMVLRDSQSVYRMVCEQGVCIVYTGFREIQQKDH